MLLDVAETRVGRSVRSIVDKIPIARICEDVADFGMERNGKAEFPVHAGVVMT